MDAENLFMVIPGLASQIQSLHLAYTHCSILKDLERMHGDEKLRARAPDIHFVL